MRSHLALMRIGDPEVLNPAAGLQSGNKPSRLLATRPDQVSDGSPDFDILGKPSHISVENYFPWRMFRLNRPDLPRDFSAIKFDDLFSSSRFSDDWFG